MMSMEFHGVAQGRGDLSRVPQHREIQIRPQRLLMAGRIHPQISGQSQFGLSAPPTPRARLIPNTGGSVWATRSTYSACEADLLCAHSRSCT